MSENYKRLLPPSPLLSSSTEPCMCFWAGQVRLQFAPRVSVFRDHFILKLSSHAVDPDRCNKYLRLVWLAKSTACKRPGLLMLCQASLELKLDRSCFCLRGFRDRHLLHLFYLTGYRRKIHNVANVQRNVNQYVDICSNPFVGPSLRRLPFERTLCKIPDCAGISNRVLAVKKKIGVDNLLQRSSRLRLGERIGWILVGRDRE